METRSRGFHHWTNYEVEGDAARIIGHFEREQTQAAIAPRTEFAMRFYGHGRGIKIGVRATAHRLPSPRWQARQSQAPSPQSRQALQAQAR